jgi:hypothetical protein
MRLDGMNQRSPSASTAEFFNTIGTFRTKPDVRLDSAMGSTADVARFGMRVPRKAVRDCSAVGMGCGSLFSSNRISARSKAQQQCVALGRRSTPMAPPRGEARNTGFELVVAMVTSAMGVGTSQSRLTTCRCTPDYSGQPTIHP